VRRLVYPERPSRRAAAFPLTAPARINSNSVAQAFRPEAFLLPVGFAFVRVVFVSPFCHSERSLRSEDRCPIARLLCDESLVSLLGAAPLVSNGVDFFFTFAFVLLFSFSVFSVVNSLPLNGSA
jgi:hypothetical protein